MGGASGPGSDIFYRGLQVCRHAFLVYEESKIAPKPEGDERVWNSNFRRV